MGLGFGPGSMPGFFIGAGGGDGRPARQGRSLNHGIRPGADWRVRRGRLSVMGLGDTMGLGWWWMWDRWLRRAGRLAGSCGIYVFSLICVDLPVGAVRGGCGAGAADAGGPGGMDAVSGLHNPLLPVGHGIEPVLPVGLVGRWGGSGCFRWSKWCAGVGTGCSGSGASRLGLVVPLGVMGCARG